MATFFLPTDTPGGVGNYNSPVSTAFAFFVSTPVNALGVRFYRDATDPATSHTVNLWDCATQASLAQASSSGEAAVSGWVEVLFSSPVALTANKAYKVSVFNPQYYYVYALQWFNAPSSHGIITAYADLTVPPSNGPNGSYDGSGSIAYPNSPTGVAGNYYVDVKTSDPPPTNVVQGPLTASGGSGVHLIAKAYTANVTATNFLVAVVSCATSAVQAATVTDSLGQTWTKSTYTNDSSPNIASGIYYFPNTLGGACTVTFDAGTSASYPEITLYEVNGIALTACTDGATSATGNSTTPASGSITTSNANDLLVAAAVTSGVGMTAGTAGWTSIITPNGCSAEYLAVSTAGANNATFTASTGTWVANIAAFKFVSGAPPPPILQMLVTN